MRNKTVEQLAKEYRKTTPNQMYGDEFGFISGFSARKEIEQKVLKDLLNKYKSHLQQETRPKLGRTPNFEKEISYRAYIEIIKELQNKLK